MAKKQKIAKFIGINLIEIFRSTFMNMAQRLRKQKYAVD